MSVAVDKKAVEDSLQHDQSIYVDSVHDPTSKLVHLVMSLRLDYESSRFFVLVKNSNNMHDQSMIRSNGVVGDPRALGCR